MKTLLAVVVIIAALAGCAAPPSGAATPSDVPSGASGTLPHTISGDFTTPLLDVRTDGREIAWSKGAPDTDPAAAPDLWAFMPGDAEPRQILQNSNRDSVLALVAVHAGRFAAVETNSRLYGENGYRLWLLGGGVPVLIDQSDWHPGDRTIPVPFMTMSDQQLVWVAVHHAAGGLRFELLSYDLSKRETKVVESADASATSLWFPSFDQDGKRLVYSTIEDTAGREQFHVYELDQVVPGSLAKRLDRDGLATMPVISGDTVVWKTVRENIFNANTLARYSLARPSDAPVPLSVLGGGQNYPSLGSRYLVAWQDADSDVGLFDLRSGERRSIDPVPSSVQEGRERAVIAGALLVYLRADLSQEPKPLQLTWLDLSAE